MEYGRAGRKDAGNEEKMFVNANLPVIFWFISDKFCGINLNNDRKCFLQTEL